MQNVDVDSDLPCQGGMLGSSANLLQRPAMSSGVATRLLDPREDGTDRAPSQGGLLSEETSDESINEHDLSVSGPFFLLEKKMNSACPFVRKNTMRMPRFNILLHSWITYLYDATDASCGEISAASSKNVQDAYI